MSELSKQAAADARVARLVDAALASAWSYTEDIPWDRTVDPEKAGIPTESFLAQDMPRFRRMSARQKRALVFREACFHLSNLLAGERSGEKMGAQILVATAEENPGHREFLALLVQEEAKHFLSLRRYLADKAQALYPPDPALARVLAQLEVHSDPSLKLLVGQVVLEGTAATLLASLLLRAKEPLVAAILRYNLRDEARHVAFSYLVLEPRARSFPARLAREMEDMIYESIAGCVTSLLAVPVWREAGLAVRPARRAAVARLKEMGVLDRYARHVPAQLERRGFPTARLSRLLAGGLERGLAQ